MTADLLAADLLAAVLLRATVLLAVAALVDRLALRRASAAARHLCWSLAVGALLALPAAHLALPAWRVAVPVAHAVEAAPRPAAPAAVPPPASALPPAGETPLAAPTDFVAAAPPPPAPSRRLPAWPDLLLGAYAAVAALLLGRVAVQHAAARALARRAAPLDGAGWAALAHEASAALGLRRRVTLRRAADATMPLTWGVVRPVVLLPADAEEWPASRRRAVLLHELAHVARRDCLTQALAAAACALYWPHPGIWWAAARLRAERELACDDRVLERGVGAHAYAADLLAVARGYRPPRALGAVAVTMAAPSQLERRLRAALDGARARRAPGARAAAAATSLALVLLAPTAAVRAVAVAPGAPASVAAVVAPVAPPVAPPAAAQPPVAPAPAPAPAIDGEWTMRAAGPGEAEGGAPAVHVMLWRPGLNTFVVERARMEGLPADAFGAGGGRAEFTLARDAGTFRFDGAFRGGTGRGRFTFDAAPAFADELARRGMARPTPAQQFELARHGLELAYLDELAAQGYAQPTTAELVRVSLTGVDLAYLRGMSALGYRFGRVATLVRLHNQGVGPAFVRSLGALTRPPLPAEELLRLRRDGDAVRRTSAAAPAPAPGPEPRPAEPPAASARAGEGDGSTPRSGRWIVHRTRDGRVDLELFWSDDTNWRRWFPASALRPADGGLRIAGDAGAFELDGALADGRGGGALRFRPDSAVLPALRALGVRDAGTATEHQLKNLTWGATGAAEARELLAMGYGPLTLRELIDLAIFEVTPAYARAAREAGVRLQTTRDLVDLRHAGVPADYAPSLVAAGVPAPTGEQLQALWRARVTPSFVRTVRGNGERDLSPDHVLALWTRFWAQARR